MYDYGNARVAALRSRLLDALALVRLEECGSAGAFLSLLERAEDWRIVVREVGPLAADPGAAVELAIERHRTVRLGGLLGWYPPRTRRLIEALVLPLDLERLVAVLRRRRAGEDPERVAAGVVGGALLDSLALARIARAPSAGAALESAARAGLLERRDAAAATTALERDGWAAFEAGLTAAVDRARRARAGGGGRDRAAVRAILAREAAIRARVVEELVAGGAASAASIEREETLARLDRLAREGPRDPLGIGVVAGYAAAVEAQAIRLRAALARASVGWSPRLVAAYRAPGRG